MKTSDLDGAALNWAVAKCESVKLNEDAYSPSTDWSQAGPIIERERIQITPGHQAHDPDKWSAIKYDHIFDGHDAFQGGDTPLIAAMKCYVTSKLGYEMEIPEGLR